MKNDRVTVLGAGLAGCEAAYQLAERGIAVSLVEMRPLRRSPAHKTDLFGELVCSNSLRSDRIQNGVGLLKEEMRRMGSVILACADATRVPAGGALAVDREGFARLVTERIKNHPNITVMEAEATEIPEPPAIIATGPLTDGKLLENIEAFIGEGLHFYDAAAPVVTKESLNMDRVFEASRYDRGSDYLNCAMTRDEYYAFVRELVAAETAPLHSFETPKVFEGCMPVEVMAKRGERTLAFGPLKPVGLSDPRMEGRPYAVVQLRQDDAEGTLYNIVGFQTNLKFGEQKRVFGMIPGLENAEYVRYGVMHRNTFLNSPGKLDPWYQVKAKEGLYFAGQITGVEGYVESAASGMVAGIDLAGKLLGRPRIEYTQKTALGALGHYVSGYAGKDFQPMNISFGIIEGIENPPRNKQERYTKVAERSLAIIDRIRQECE
ncbi:MAG: methylenetetrahydrofolate--tRNA-(uracil(54)-C(5))-methyltransferase (FADH(2)-oxidizing) TrmFO [Clostridiales bacterium]|nr:methylenetetrahydrofolate--tRNA-(uracil(54)-C(5))-methyltransferase (FADH(2)-oxidizing) TrmFO [Clostridiales bacterium]